MAGTRIDARYFGGSTVCLSKVALFDGGGASGRAYLAGNVLEPTRNGALAWMDALIVARRG